jgi:hypothetical protein
MNELNNQEWTINPYFYIICQLSIILGMQMAKNKNIKAQNLRL